MIAFPDIEKVLVSELTALLAEHAPNARVGTIKTDTSDPQVIITANYTSTDQVMIREATATVEVWAADYSTASDLGLLVGSLIVHSVGDPIKRCVVNVGPVRMAEPSGEELRMLSVDMTVRGTDF